MSIFTPLIKNTAVMTGITKASNSTFTPLTKTSPKVPAGLYYGFGAFTYSGGQAVTGSLLFTGLNKS